MNYKKLNNITGWVVFAIAAVVYLLTVEETASFWDCGEFIAAAYKLQVPHPPGAPLFLLVGRMFSFLAGADAFAGEFNESVAYYINLVSVFTSAFTILFLFWTISFLAKKIVAKDEENPEMGKIIAILGSSTVGALAYTFSDSFWFSAVEAEVYAFSSFFTAFVFWAIFKWDAEKDERIANKWLIMLFFMMGLSIGTHLLNLVTIPALAMVYYFKKYTPTKMGIFMAFMAGLIIVGIINAGVIPGLPTLAGKFEVFFINNLGLPIGTGIVIFLILFVAALVYAIMYSIKTKNELLNTAILSFCFVVIGYLTYMMIPIRSSYDPPIDENNPEDIMSFVSYLKREQYGDRPLIYGPTALSQLVDQKQGAPLYRKKGDKYVIYNHKMENIYDDKHKSLFPRIYNAGSVQTSIESYKSRGIDLDKKKKITLVDNINYFFSYQLKVMYWRYFFWNFAGRAHDVQGADWLAAWENNNDLPHRVEFSKARNQFYMLPLILGLIGIFFQVKRDQNNAFVTGLLFFFTGIALVIFLNSPPNEPRERDYIYVGSFYAFAIWIGLGVLAIFDYLSKIMQNKVVRSGLATALGLTIPLIMAAEGWDDHDRSGRWHSVDSAKNLLNSCAPNAILYTGGDNDTFPLWYVQEVEGFRTDVRVCNLSLLNTDWYIDLMKQDAYDSKALPIKFEKDQYISGTNDVLMVMENKKYESGISLPAFMAAVRKGSKEIQVPLRGGGTASVAPSKTYSLPVNKEILIASGAIKKSDYDKIPDNLVWRNGKSRLEKKHLIMLDMMVNNNWERPIYYSTTVGSSDYLGLANYLQLEGLALRVVPIKNNRNDGEVNTELMYDNMINKTFWRGLDDETRFFDENYLRFPSNSRNKFLRLASQYLSENNKQKSLEVINFCLEKMPDKAVPYDYNIPRFVDLLYRLGENERADEIADVIYTRAKQTLEYYDTHEEDTEQIKGLELHKLSILHQTYQRNNMKEKGEEVYALLLKYYKPQ